MRFSFNLLLAALPFVPTVFSRALVDKRQTTGVDAWVTLEEPIARSSLFRNIGNQGEFAKGVDAGAVIASPSRDSPDYYYQWARDSGLVYKVILNQFLNGNSSLEQYLKDFTTETKKLQHTNNPSGGYTSGGIGEPKFNVDGSAYTGGWGRPQTDGPAIRATVLAKYANFLLDRAGSGDEAYVRSQLYDSAFPTESVIKADLEYVSHYWTDASGFDLWEETKGIHFFNLMVQRRALVEGAELATRLGDSGAATWYNQQAAAIDAKIPSFWNSNKGYLVTTLDNSRTGQDCGTLLGALHGTGKRGFGNYTPGSDQILATLQALVDVFKPLYPINAVAGYPGVAIGRYPSDVYDGVGTSAAHPWFLCTFAVAETLYTATTEFNTKGSIAVSSISQNFFKKFLSSASAGSSYAKDSSDYNTIIAGIRTYADSFVAVGQRHAAANGSMSEQFSRYDGFQKGARDLTWSYASFLTMKHAREGNTPY